MAGNANSGRKRKSMSAEKGKMILAKACPEAAAVIIDMMRCVDRDLSYKAATYIHDYVHGKATQRQDITMIAATVSPDAIARAREEAEGELEAALEEVEVEQNPIIDIPARTGKTYTCTGEGITAGEIKVD